MQRTPPVAPAAPAGIPPVATIVPRQGWWSNYPQLGEEQAFAPDATSWQTILEADELGPPEVYTHSGSRTPSKTGRAVAARSRSKSRSTSAQAARRRSSRSIGRKAHRFRSP